MRYLTAGESHGRQLTVIVEGMPSGLPVSVEEINLHLARRQKGYGRGKRQQIEQDRVQVVAGIRHGKTTGAPIAMVIENKDWIHWQDVMGIEPLEEGVEVRRRVTRPRPGHADLNGAIKYNLRDMRDVLERSSARETAARVAVGALVRQLLEYFDVEITAHVRRIGSVWVEDPIDSLSVGEIVERTEKSQVRCISEEASLRMMEEIDQAKKDGDSLGGVVEVVADGLPVGLGSHVHWDRKLDARLARAVVSIQAFKGVEFGLGFEAGAMRGSQVHDPIVYEGGRFRRQSSNSGGIEGGMSTGERLLLRGVMKPIPTLYKPLASVDIETKEPFLASIERSDNCAVPAASVVAENVVAWELADAFLEKFGGDSLKEIEANYSAYQEHVRGF